MSEGRRPGGLTALAVINFVFGGFNCLGVLGMAALIALFGVMSDELGNSGDPADRELIGALEELGMPVFLVMLALSVLGAFLLIASGVGYLQQKKFLGRTLGNTYAIVAIVASLGMGLIMPMEAGGGMNLGTLIGLIYPVLTLVLLNTTFKDDFIR